MAAPTSTLIKKDFQFVFNVAKVFIAAMFICFHSYAGKQERLLIKEIVLPSDTIISGIVKDAKGKPIPNAKISSAIAGDVFTNSDGLFSITLKTEKIIPQSFIFSYDTLMPVVRSYHPVMENAMYEITLEPNKCCLCDLLINRTDDLPLGSIDFMPTDGKLSTDTKTKLKDIAAQLKGNPELKIIATAYSSTNKTKQKLASKRLQSITEYFIEHEGISSDRIATEQKTADSESSKVEFKKQ